MKRMTQPERNAWARAFLASIGRTPMRSEDYTLAVHLRDRGLTPEYAAARVQLRVLNRTRSAA